MPGAHHRRLPYHLLAVLLGVLLVLVGSTALDAPAQAATRETRELERDVVALVNIERAKQGLGALSIEKDIRKVARAHSERMADADDLHHNPDFSTQITGWSRVAENVGVGPSVTRVHEA
ncbi:MAG: CAP domain-containing protein, partial [Actinomycetota bacterium]